MINKEEILNKYADEIILNDIQFSTLRLRLEKEEGVSKDEINSLVVEIDDYSQLKLQQLIIKKEGLQLLYIGIGISSLGSLLTLLTYIGVIQNLNYVISFYGPVIAGALMIVRGRKRIDKAKRFLDPQPEENKKGIQFK